MPLPQPKPGETQNEFMQRCVTDQVMQSEFPMEQQRLAVCYTQWKEKK
jgi:hypothetical protein